MILSTGKNNPKFICLGFTLAELLLSVVVLSFGLAAIIGAYLIAGSALEGSQSRGRAVEILKEKFATLKEDSLKNGGVEPQTLREEVALNSRPASYSLEIVPLAAVEELDLGEYLNSAKLSLSWKERNISKDISVIAYREKTKQE